MVCLYTSPSTAYFMHYCRTAKKYYDKKDPAETLPDAAKPTVKKEKKDKKDKVEKKSKKNKK